MNDMKFVDNSVLKKYINFFKLRLLLGEIKFIFLISRLREYSGNDGKNSDEIGFMRVNV